MQHHAYDPEVEVGGGSNPWVTCWTGARFHLYGDDPREIQLEDIAHHLSMVSRFTGGLLRPYSVAEHSILVMKLVAASGGSTEEMLQGLMHDAPEAYIADIASPFKAEFGGYIEHEDRIWRRICDKLNVEYEMCTRVKEADTLAYFIESISLSPKGHHRESRNWDRYGPIALAFIEQEGAIVSDMLHPLELKQTFIQCFEALQAGDTQS